MGFPGVPVNEYKQQCLIAPGVHVVHNGMATGQKHCYTSEQSLASVCIMKPG